MKALVGVVTFGLMATILTGCEGGWQFGGSAQTYNESGNWWDISGVYVGTSGKYLVSNYTGMGAISSNTVQETIGATVVGQTVYSGTLSTIPVTSGTLAISITGIAAGHASTAGAITGTGISTGTVDFNTGFWTITLSAAPAAVVNITATYNASGSSSTGPGSSGVVIHTFNVQQSGNQLIVTDNNGSVYKGSIGATAPNVNTNATYVTYAYDVSGVSAAGYNVQMVGAFYASSTNSAMTGTWLEQGGKTGNIDGNRQY